METGTMKRLFIALIVGPLLGLAAATAAVASEAGYRLDPAPIDPRDAVSIQAGARTFANYCLNCHSAQFMRYNRLGDLGLTEAQIKENLVFAGDKVGDTMKTALIAKDAKAWFGVVPPDLTVIARSRGSDWLYTYLRTFYRDPKTTTGWNNAVFPNVGMPHALWTLQGERALEVVHAKDGHSPVEYKWTQLSDGRQTNIQYDTTVRDLVNYLVWMGEPAAMERKKIGVVVLYFLGVLFVLAYAMKRAFWKDVH
jgi:ubiquinol-cytochrome c reductase cytochrome c1 subunit